MVHRAIAGIWFPRSSTFRIPEWSERDEQLGRWAGLATREECLAVEPLRE
jgi:hypothetical protein